MILPVVTASLGSFKQKDCVTIKTILNTSLVNISSLSDPNSTIILTNQNMTKNGLTFSYNFCNTSKLGFYTYDYFDAEGNVYVNDFEITPSGNDSINSGEGLTLFSSVIVLLIIAGFFFVLSFFFNGVYGKIIFIGFSGILLVIAILFTLVNMTQTLGGFDAIVEGYSTFWFVIKIVVGIAITCLVVFTVLASYNAWMIKRGFRD